MAQPCPYPCDPVCLCLHHVSIFNFVLFGVFLPAFASNLMLFMQEFEALIFNYFVVWVFLVLFVHVKELVDLFNSLRWPPTILWLSTIGCSVLAIGHCLFGCWHTNRSSISIFVLIDSMLDAIVNNKNSKGFVGQRNERNVVCVLANCTRKSYEGTWQILEKPVVHPAKPARDNPQ